MNLLHSKSRNSLKIGTVDKLCFIYINSRSLRSDKGTEEWDEDALMALEDTWLAKQNEQEQILGKRSREEDE
jgi:hypothetical protein